MSMKLHKVLTVGGAVLPLIQDEVRLQLKHPGRASFTVQAGAPVKGLVTLDIGYNERQLQRHFIGYVERSTAANGQQQIRAATSESWRNTAGVGSHSPTRRLRSKS